MDKAADYTDEWYRVGAGREEVSFRSYFICGRVVGETVCSTLTMASHWLRRFMDPLEKDQRWYCPVCETKYEPQSGMLVELVTYGRAHYVLAPYPPVEFREVKWASVRRCHPRATNPEETPLGDPRGSTAFGGLPPCDRG